MAEVTAVRIQSPHSSAGDVKCRKAWRANPCLAKGGRKVDMRGKY